MLSLFLISQSTKVPGLWGNYGCPIIFGPIIFLPGNEAGLTLEEFNHPSEEHKAMKRSIAEPRLRAAGAHYVIDTITDLPAVIEQIETRLTLGESPEGPLPLKTLYGKSGSGLLLCIIIVVYYVKKRYMHNERPEPSSSIRSFPGKKIFSS